MRQLITAITLSFLFSSCNQTNDKQKELPQNKNDSLPQQKEIAKTDSLTPVIATAPDQIKSKEESWNDFWALFSNAVKQKDKATIIKLALKGDDFFDGGGGGTAEYTVNSWDDKSWGDLVSTITKGVKPYEKTDKITKKGGLIFVYRNNNWFWFGFIGD